MTATEPAGLWERIWFAPEHPATLTFVRWIVFTAVAVNTWTGRHSFRAIPDRPAAIWEPISLVAALRMPQPTPWVVETLLLTILMGSALTVLRVWPRVTGLLAASSYLFLILFLHSFGKISHGHQPLVVMALVLACVPAPRSSEPPDWRWGWPVQLCRAAMGVMLAAAALSKVQGAGLEWVLSETMRNILVIEGGVQREPALPGMALWIASEPWRWQAAAAGAVIGEAALIFSLAVRSSLLRALLVIAGIGTVSGITLLMGLIGFPIVALGAIFASPGKALDGLAAGRAAVRVLPPPLLGLVALAVVLVMHSGGIAVALPPVAGAAVLLATTLHPGRSTRPTGTATRLGRAERAPRS